MMIASTILALLISILALTVILSLLYSAVRYVPFVPTESAVVKKMIDAADLKDGQSIVDLGCGDGRFLIAALKNNKNIRATGVEINLLISWLARFRLWLRGVKAQIIRGNFFDVSLRDSDLVFCYLFPKIMKRLESKFAEELRPGAKIVSYCFPIRSWKPSRIIQTRSDKPKNFLIYVYQIPCQPA